MRRVGFDTTYGLLSETGIGRYVRSLGLALEALDGVQLVPLAATRHPSHRRLPRAAQGLIREGLWYPALIERAALEESCSLLHMPQPVMVRARRLPLVITVHDLLPLDHPQLFTVFPRAQARASLRSLRRASRILTNSEYTRSTVIERLGLAPEAVVATPLGVAASFHPLEPDPELLRERFGIGGPFILSVGTLEPRKNLATALRAFERIASREPDCELVVAGPKGWRNQDFERILERSPSPVHLTGFLTDDDLALLYSATACFLYPSLAEGFGLPVAEALACGAPVVTSDRTSLPEVAGDAALLVDPEDEEAIGEAALRILGDPDLATDLRRRGLERARAFSWERCAEATARVYEEVAGGA